MDYHNYNDYYIIHKVAPESAAGIGIGPAPTSMSTCMVAPAVIPPASVSATPSCHLSATSVLDQDINSQVKNYRYQAFYHIFAVVESIIYWTMLFLTQWNLSWATTLLSKAKWSANGVLITQALGQYSRFVHGQGLMVVDGRVVAHGWIYPWRYCS